MLDGNWRKNYHLTYKRLSKLREIIEKDEEYIKRIEEHDRKSREFINDQLEERELIEKEFWEKHISEV